MQLISPAFHDNERIPKLYTADGEDISPPLAWSDVPAKTAAFALVVEDPDAPRGTFVHWLLYDLPGDTSGVDQSVAKNATTSLDGARQGRNDFGDYGYGGPAPPPPAEHRYVFQLLALDAATGLDAGASRKQLESAVDGHVLAIAQLTGRYRRGG